MRSALPVCAALLLGTTSSFSAAIAVPSSARAATGGVVINGDAAWTKTSLVQVALPAPAGAQGMVRLSNDGSTWSANLPWAPSVAWSLTDASAGGSAGDGEKTVYVRWDDGSGTWPLVGRDDITLDTTPARLWPWSFVGLDWEGAAWPWRVYVSPGVWDDAGAQDKFEFSMDGGKSWWPQYAPLCDMGEGGVLPCDHGPADRFQHLDLRTMQWGGSWATGERSVCVRMVDLAGNPGVPECPTIVIDPNPPSGLVVKWEFPRPAVTGQLFTVRPVYPAGWVPDPELVCLYVLSWGDEHLLDARANEYLGHVQFERKAKDGGCGEWTFTLPYTAGLTYNFYLQHVTRYGYCTCETYENVTTFRATIGTTERGIPQSTIPLVYLLPSATLTAPGDPVTYTLEGSGAVTPPNDGWFYAYGPAGPNYGFDQFGGTSFTYAPNSEGAWFTGWTGYMYGLELRAYFDPPSDGHAPAVTGPRPIPARGLTVGSTVPTSLTWTAVDPKLKTGEKGSGLAKVKLQVSRNGGTWQTLTLSSAKATSASLNLAPSGTYRYRVRAWDRAGNRSAWAYGPTFRPRVVQETSSSVTRTGTWSTLSSTSLLGGTGVRSTTSGSTATLAFYGRAVGWISRVGPAEGLAQVYVDGILTQTVDLRATTTADRRIVFSRTWSSLANHVLRVRVLGTFSRPGVVVDGFVVIK